jgi:DNA-directed RNA polymerase subunit beta'
MEDAILAFEQGLVDLHARVWLRFDGPVESDQPEVLEQEEEANGIITRIYNDRRVRLDQDGSLISQYIKTTTGRIIYNKAVLEAIEN